MQQQQPRSYSRCARTRSNKLVYMCMFAVEVSRRLCRWFLIFGLLFSRSQPPAKACPRIGFLYYSCDMCVSNLGFARWHHVTRRILLHARHLSVSSYSIYCCSCLLKCAAYVSEYVQVRLVSTCCGSAVRSTEFI